MKYENVESGFSLVEVTVSLLVLTVVMGIAFTLLASFQRSYRYEEAYADAQRNARFAVARLAEVIRSAGTNPTANSTVNPSNFLSLLGTKTTSGVAVTAGSIELKSDFNGDTLNTERVASNSDVIVISEDVTISLDSDHRQILLTDNTPGGSTIILADNVESLSFTDSNGASNTNKTVQIQIVAVPAGISDSDPRYRRVSYSEVVRLRNR